MPLALLVLSLSAFAIGTTEFVIMGLLPDVAHDLSVSLPAAGWLISAYALAVAFGAPVMAMITARWRRRTALLSLMVIFVLGNLFCAIAANYGLLVLARVVTALCHGAFFGIGSVTAAGLVEPNRRARAVALMFTGLTLANVLGVPLGTALGQAAGWRTPFWAVVALGLLSFAGLRRALPVRSDETPADLRRELRGLRSTGVWLALGTTVCFSAAMFALFTYIAPLLLQVTGVTPRGVSWTLFAMGVGLTIGNALGGRLADWNLSKALSLVLIALCATSLALHWTAPWLWPSEANLFLWAVAAFAAVPALQVNVMRFGAAAPNLISTLNIGAFNLGNAFGAWVGGLVLSANLGLQATPLAAAALALLGVFASSLSGRLARDLPAQPDCATS
ncbi:MFS transporter [Chitinasiproducens palmae]|uniref:MFS transporter, DHA1 family, inner membrane transport protein n=1 Tax=Chitinasiproducens palmae TaxID=1770053 RepID=A0A1H2PK43_9BURK|nr:MFS transporter [Chitinasiproducens palmae]SDV46663.1 MFS transporter, DHA1 family, inner membrane transport protein [Chitinasiproducens palmae]